MLCSRLVFIDLMSRAVDGSHVLSHSSKGGYGLIVISRH